MKPGERFRRLPSNVVVFLLSPVLLLLLLVIGGVVVGVVVMTGQSGGSGRRTRSGGKPDTGLAYVMLGLIGLAAVGIFGTLWLVSRPRLSAAEKALAEQPAVLVEGPASFRVSQTPGFGECDQPATQVRAVGVSDGSVLWQQDVSNPYQEFFGEWYVLDDEDGPAALVQIDAGLNDLPPSIRAIDIASGDLAWQRFLELEQVTRAAQSATELVVQGVAVDDGAPNTLVTLAVDAHGALSRSPDVQFDSSLPFDPSAQFGPGFWLTSDVANVIVDGDTQRQVYAGGGDGGRIDIWDVATGTTVNGDRLPLDEVYQGLGASSSPGLPLQANDSLILAVIGSPMGPNTRLAVFDGVTGSFKWSIEDTRAGALAGDHILYDKRNEEPIDAESTRDLYLVDGADVDRVVWSTALAVNEAGGNGFLGMIGEDLVFAVTSGTGDLEFLTISDESDVPELLQAADWFGSGPSRRHHVDEDILVAGADTGFVVQIPGGDAERIDTDRPVSWVKRADDRVLIVASDQPACD